MTTTKRQGPTTTLSDRAANMTSVVSYPKRCSLWGRADYRGNCDGRLFLGLVLRYRPKRVADPMMGSGTTRDVIAWLNRTERMHIEYWGGDLQAGFNLLADELPGKFDLVWLHPPYWNIIRYSRSHADLSSCDSFTQFIKRLRCCLRRSYSALRPGGRLAVLVGDVRRDGIYIPLVQYLLSMQGELGDLRSIIVKVQHNCQSDRKAYAPMEDVPIKHEYCVVFKKPRDR